MKISDVAAMFRRGWWLIALVTIIGGIAGTLYGVSQPTVYSSTTHGYVVVNNSGTSGGDTFNAGQAAQSRMASYAALATTPSVTAGVATALQLNMSPLEVAQHLSVNFPPGTLLLDIKATADAPRLATDLAAETLRQLQKQVETLESPAPGIPPWARVETVDEPTILVTSAPVTWTFIVGGIVGGAVLGTVLGYLYALLGGPGLPLRRKPRAPHAPTTPSAPAAPPTVNGQQVRETMSRAGAGPEHPVTVGGGNDDSRHAKGDS